MYLLAVKQWVDPCRRGKITLVGDAEGVLSSITRMRSEDSVINSMSKEFAMILAPLGFELQGLHIWGEQNDWADALSRVGQGQEIPSELEFVPAECLDDRRTAIWHFLEQDARKHKPDDQVDAT